MKRDRFIDITWTVDVSYDKACDKPRKYPLKYNIHIENICVSHSFIIESIKTTSM